MQWMSRSRYLWQNIDRKEGNREVDNKIKVSYRFNHLSSNEYIKYEVIELKGYIYMETARIKWNKKA